MNSRRKFLTFLGLAPVAVATGAVAAVNVHGLSAKDANVGEIVAGQSLYDPRTIAELEEANAELRFGAAFDRHAMDWVRNAYDDNISVIVLAAAGRMERMEIREFMLETDSVYVTRKKLVVHVLNKRTGSTAFLYRTVLRTA